MSSLYILRVFIFFVALNSFSAAENNAHDAISRDEFEQMKNVMKILQEKVQMQEARIVDLEKEIKELKNGNEESSKRTMTASRRQEGEAKQLQFRSPKHQESEVIDVQEDGVKQERPQVRIVPAPTESVVAFYAYMSTTESNPSTHHTIIYDHEVTNIGNGYNRHSGTFIAPVDGVYVFSWTIFMSVPGEYMSIELTLNSQPVGASYVHGIYDYSTASGTAALSMQKNDIVFTRTHTTYAPHGSIRSDNLMRTALSGWCISCH